MEDAGDEGESEEPAPERLHQIVIASATATTTADMRTQDPPRRAALFRDFPTAGLEGEPALAVEGCCCDGEMSFRPIRCVERT